MGALKFTSQIESALQARALEKLHYILDFNIRNIGLVVYTQLVGGIQKCHDGIQNSNILVGTNNSMY